MHALTMGHAVVCAAATGALFAETLQSGSVPQALRAWWVDPAVATVSFSAAIDFFDRRERTIGCGSDRKFMSAGSLMTLVFSGLLYWIGVTLWVTVVPPPAAPFDNVPFSLGELAYLLSELVGGVVAYDFVFYCIHIGMHWSNAEAHRVHHSKEADLRARDVLLHSPLDGTLQVLVNILVQRNTPWGLTKSRTARILHNVVVTWMLTESHTASPEPRLARRFFAGVQRHRMHHTEGKRYYQQFFGYLDDARIALHGR